MSFPSDDSLRFLLLLFLLFLLITLNLKKKNEEGEDIGVCLHIFVLFGMISILL